MLGLRSRQLSDPDNLASPGGSNRSSPGRFDGEMAIKAILFCWYCRIFSVQFTIFTVSSKLSQWNSLQIFPILVMIKKHILLNHVFNLKTRFKGFYYYYYLFILKKFKLHTQHVYIFSTYGLKYKRGNQFAAIKWAIYALIFTRLTFSRLCYPTCLTLSGLKCTPIGPLD